MSTSRAGSLSGVTDVGAVSRLSMDRPMPSESAAKPLMDEIRESLSEWVNDEHANTQERDLRDYVATGLLQSIEEALPSQGDEWLRSEVLIDNLMPPDLSRFKIDVSFTPPAAQADVAQVAPAAVRQVDVPKVASREGLYIQNRIASLSVLSRLLGGIL